MGRKPPPKKEKRRESLHTFICLKMVDLPDSPAPNSSSLIFSCSFWKAAAFAASTSLVWCSYVRPSCARRRNDERQQRHRRLQTGTSNGNKDTGGYKQEHRMATKTQAVTDSNNERREHTRSLLYAAAPLKRASRAATHTYRARYKMTTSQKTHFVCIIARDIYEIAEGKAAERKGLNRADTRPVPWNSSFTGRTYFC